MLTMPHVWALNLTRVQLIRNGIKATRAFWCPIYITYFCQKKIITMSCVMRTQARPFKHCFEFLSFFSQRRHPVMWHLVYSHCILFYTHTWWSFEPCNFLWLNFFFLYWCSFPGFHVVFFCSLDSSLFLGKWPVRVKVALLANVFKL